mgnify:CR=1 FL=1
MFRSATFKLTGWYLAILMAISLIFSIAIYQLNYNEVNIRLENFQQGILNLEVISGITVNTDAMRTYQAQEASRQMIATLFYVNMIILISGGAGSYLLARRTLRPLEKAHEAQRRFTSDASHELRTPLAAMKTELEVTLRDSNLSRDEAREILESTLEEVNKLTALSDVLLKLARLDYDKLERCPVHLQSLMNGSLKRFTDAQSRIVVKKHKPVHSFGNEAALQEVMTVLIDNALKYSYPDTQITVRFFNRRLNVGFSVTNTGPTIAEEHLEKIFERFFRSDESRTESGKHGYGIGLAIAKKIVDLHAGELTVLSQNNTTVFTCYLPHKRSVPARIQGS